MWQCLRCGEANLWTMELLYEANATLGKPEPTEVRVTPVPGKAILISGHDLHVMEGLLKACEPHGIKVYTHGEVRLQTCRHTLCICNVCMDTPAQIWVYVCIYRI
jgi:hydroxylamine reductase (hybrid-cluster protein)